MNSRRTMLLDRLADLFEYPGADFLDRLQACLAESEMADRNEREARGSLFETGTVPSPAPTSGAGVDVVQWRAQSGTDLKPQGGSTSGLSLTENLCSFSRAVQSLSTREREELFVSTFDLNPVCSLEVGWHLFGDTYDRGKFLLRMRQELRCLGVAESTELPDHLTSVLRALGRMPAESASPFVRQLLLPAMERMSAGLANRDNPYQFLLCAARLAALAVGDLPEPTATAALASEEAVL